MEKLRRLQQREAERGEEGGGVGVGEEVEAIGDEGMYAKEVRRGGMKKWEFRVLGF